MFRPFGAENRGQPMTELPAGAVRGPMGARIGSGRVADVHAWGPHALKLYHRGRGKEAAFLEAAVLALLEAHGLPVPRVHETGAYDGRWGLVLDRAEGPTLGEIAIADAARVPECLEEMIRLQLMLHAVQETRLRPLKARLASNISRTPLLDAALGRRLLERLAALPDGDRICHGDFHPHNIVGRPGRTTVIDWLDATCGPPAADACRSYLLLRLGAPPLADAYLDLFVERSRLERHEILDWLPVVAAARLVEDVPDDEPVLLGLAGSV